MQAGDWFEIQVGGKQRAADWSQLESSFSGVNAHDAGGGGDIKRTPGLEWQVIPLAPVRSDCSVELTKLVCHLSLTSATYSALFQ